MSDEKLSYGELRQRLEQVEAALAALRRGEVDLVMGADGLLLVRVKSLVEENERLAQQWQATFDAANDAIWMLDGEQRILQSNRTAERLFGKPRQEMIDRRCWEIVHGTTEPIPECPMLRGKRSLCRESMALPLGERWFEVTVDPILDKEGSYAGAVHIVSDITERKQAEEELAGSEQFLASVIEQNPTSTWISDGKGTLVKMNRACRELFGVTEAEVVGKYNILQDNLVEAQGHMPLVRDVFDKGESARFTLDYDARDVKHIDVKVGKRRILDVVVSPIRDAQGNVTNAIVQHSDVTDLRRAKHDLEASEARYRRLFESAKDGILILDAGTGAIVDVNPFILDLLGYPYEAFVGKHLWDIGEFKDIAASQVSFQQLQTKEYVRYEDLPLQTRDKRRIDVEFVSNVYLVDNQKVIQCNIRDITERIQREERLHHLTEVLRAVRDVNQLITHEQDRDALLRRTCEILISTRGYRSAWAALRGADGAAQTVAESGIGADFAPVREALERGDWPDCCRQAQERPDDIAPIHDTDRNCTTCSLAHTYRDTAALAGALRHGGRDYGVLVVALPRDLADDPEEQSLFRELVGDVAYALHAMELAQARGEAEEALHASEERFRVAQEMSPDGFTILHPVRNEKDEIVDFAWVYENQAVARINGTDPQDVIGKRLLDLFPTHRGTAVFEAYLHVANTGKTRILEEVYVGEIVSVPTWLRLVVVSMGEDIASLAHDITARKQAEKAMQEQLDELRRWYAATLGREGRIIELKKEVNALLAQAGQGPRYPSVEQEGR